MTVAVVQFPGSNCDRDCMQAVRAVGGDAVLAWHKDVALPPSTSAVILPGGFSYGDYLRTGAMAAHAPLMKAVKRFVDDGGPVLGICNGFQILCEAGILPGVLMQNAGGRFVCKTVSLVVESNRKGLLRHVTRQQRLALPVAHGDGRFFADDATLDRLEKNDEVAFRYVDVDANGDAALNGARRAVAGILGGPRDNVLGLMPHPERRSEARLGGIDGAPLMRALLEEAR
jgi:phosphoribosylformylglycinamidine synthase I